jgi:hypothetical protein
MPYTSKAISGAPTASRCFALIPGKGMTGCTHQPHIPYPAHRSPRTVSPTSRRSQLLAATSHAVSKARKSLRTHLTDGADQLARSLEEMRRPPIPCPCCGNNLYLAHQPGRMGVRLGVCGERALSNQPPSQCRSTHHDGGIRERHSRKSVLQKPLWRGRRMTRKQ